MPQTRQPRLAIIGGSGSIDGEFVGHRNRKATDLATPFGLPSDDIVTGRSKVNEWHFWHGTGAGTV